MSAVPRRCGTASPAILLLLAAACSTLQTGFPSESDSRDRESFLARQYVQRGRAAWAMGNAENARFLLGRAVELDPLNPEAIAAWTAHWPVDSLPPDAAAARTAALAAQPGGGGAADAPGAGEAAAAERAGDARGDADARPGGGAAAGEVAAGDAAAAADPQAAADGGPPSPDAAAPPAEAAAPAPAAALPGEAAGDAAASPERDPVDDLAAAMGAVTGGPADRAAERPPAVPPEELERIRGEFESARASRDPAALRRSGEELMRAVPHHLPTLYRVLSTWVGARLEADLVETRVRDLLARLEFGDAAFLEGKPEDVSDAAWLRVHRGRFLDVLGWSAFLRGNLTEAEAALRSAETEINLRGRGDVTHLRHLAGLYEAKGDLRRAEGYAIAAAARDETTSGEARATAARIWTRRHGGTAGLESRLASEGDRVRREERSAAVADRLYAPVPILEARRSDGAVLTDQTLRGRVTVLVLWEPGCDDCLRLLQDLSARRPGARAGAARGRAAVEIVALRVDRAARGPTAGAGADPRGLPGLVFAEGRDTAPFARALEARRLPVTLVVEPEGFVQYRHAGYPADAAGRERWLERLGWQVESLAGLRPRTDSGAGPSSGSRDALSAALPSEAGRGSESGAGAVPSGAGR